MSPSHSSFRSFGRLGRGAMVGIALAGAIALTAPALADPSPGSDAAVEEAKRQEALAAASVAEIESMLTSLRDQTEQARAEAGLAAESYDKAQEELELANQAADQAEAVARDTQASLDKARGALARVALMNAQSGSDISQLEPLLNSEGLEEAMDKSAMLFVVGSAADRAASKFALAKQTAEQAQITSERAAELRAEKSAAAKDKAAAAQQAVDSAVQAEAAAEVEHEQLLEALAAKKKTTVAAEAAAEKRRLEAAEAAAREAALQQSRAQAPPAGGSDSGSGGSGGGSGGGSAGQPTTGGGSGGTAPNPPDSGGGTTDPAEPPPGGDESGAQAGLNALAWARQQIGKPYQWGGNGPSSFDCSGLTQQAWKNGGGKAIPRVAADQYAAAQKIPYSEMRPGDLIFWKRPGQVIHHVAMFSGNGMMVEAMQTGTNIHEIPIRWSGTVQYAGRY